MRRTFLSLMLLGALPGVALAQPTRAGTGRGGPGGAGQQERQQEKEKEKAEKAEKANKAAGANRPGNNKQ